MPSRASHAWWFCLSGLTALLLGASCRGETFTGVAEAGDAGADPGPGPQGGHAGGETEGDAGRAGADVVAGGAGGAAGHSSEGSCAAPADCEAGQFCRDGRCVDCDDWSDWESVAYGPAEPFTLLNDSAAQEGLRYARRLPQGTGLVYVRDFFGGVLWHTVDPSRSSGAAISTTDVFETSGLPLGLELPEPLADLNFFFSRRKRVGEDAARTRLFGAKLSSSGAVEGALELPAPFNDAALVSSYAIALSSRRAIWMRNADGMLGVTLVTSPLPTSGEPTELRLPLPGDCGFAAEFEYSPWLTPDGRTLFFAARRVDEGCAPAADAATHLYVLALSSEGQPLGRARALSGMMEADVRQSDASLSPDGCELLFSAQPELGMRLFHARRVR